MQLKTLFCTALIALSTTSFAQTWTTDSIAMGTSYANDVYYDLKTGSTKYQAGNDWHLAFQMSVFGEPSFNAAVRANHARTGLEVYVLNGIPAASFATVTAADTVGKTATALQLLNNDTSWGTGALYQNRNTSDIFSFGWGEYAGSPTHAVNGSTLYLLKTANGTAFKLWIQKYISIPTTDISYTFRIAKLDGSADNTVTIKREGTNNNFTDRLFAYYNIDSNSVINREPTRSTWDMVFTQYKEVIPGPTGLTPYTLTGLLSNQSVEVADVRAIDINDTTGFRNYPRTVKINEIGSDWKTYVNPGPNGYYKLDDSAAYFIKSKNSNEYFELHFTRFDGGGPAGQGKIVFGKRSLGKVPLAVNNVAAASLNAWYVTPNPATSNASVMIDAKTASPSARIMVTDMAGRAVLSAPLDIRQGMNAFSLATGAWPAGMYAVQVAGADWKLSTRLVVAH